MEMCYAGAIAMPSSYVVMNEEEMTYTEGGVYLNNETCVGILLTLGVTAYSAPGAVASAVVSGASMLVTIFAAIPGGAALGAYFAWAVANSAESFSSALCEAVMYGKGVDVKVGFRWFSPYLKCKVK